MPGPVPGTEDSAVNMDSQDSCFPRVYILVEETQDNFRCWGFCLFFNLKKLGSGHFQMVLSMMKEITG